MEATAAAAAAAAGAEGARAAEVVARRREGRAAAMTAAEGLEAEAREEGTEYCGRAERRTGRADAGRADAGSAIRISEAIFMPARVAASVFQMRQRLSRADSFWTSNTQHGGHLTTISVAAVDAISG